MNPEYVVSNSNQDEQKKAAVTEEMKRMQRLPPNSAYASHRLRVLNKIHHLLSLQVANHSFSLKFFDDAFCFMVIIFY